MSQPWLILAPMAGLTDAVMRAVLTRAGHYDWCVTEFVRVTDLLLPVRVFRLACPEMANGWRTAAGTPVHLQLLGSDPVALAENAARAAELGAPAIDINFGCPARVVNRHGGGAILLDDPDTVHNIVRAVRSAVPAHIPVSAKMRLGVRDRSRMLDNACGIEQAGAGWLTVHARTKADGYRPPAQWEAIADIRNAVRLPVFANGDIRSVEDAARCRQLTGCEHLMLGRGAVARPDLVNRLRINRLRDQDTMLEWPDVVALFHDFMDMMLATAESGPRHLLQTGEGIEPGWNERGALGRCKQWLALLADGYAEAVPVFEACKRMKTMSALAAFLDASAGIERRARA